MEALVASVECLLQSRDKQTEKQTLLTSYAAHALLLSILLGEFVNTVVIQVNYIHAVNAPPAATSSPAICSNQQDIPQAAAHGCSSATTTSKSQYHTQIAGKRVTPEFTM